MDVSQRRYGNAPWMYSDNDYPDNQGMFAQVLTMPAFQAAVCLWPVEPTALHC